MLNDHSILLAGQLFISGILLLYTAVIAPAQVFIWEFDDEQCNYFPTLYFDIFVDLFFLVHKDAMFCGFRCHLNLAFSRLRLYFVKVEIVLQFITGSVDLSEKYCDDIRVISAVYLSSFSGFWFDCVTSIPWSLNYLYSYQVTMISKTF